MDREHVFALAQRIESGPDAAQAREELVLGHLGTLVHVARAYEGHGLTLAQLVEAGGPGLARAIDNYDWRKGFAFATFATWWIRQAITRVLVERAAGQ